jgi:uncharacterized protein (DUF111 family)
LHQGHGGGQREPAEGPPNFVRVSLCAATTPGAGARHARQEVWQLECNLDDATGEELGFLLEELRSAGALDAWSSAAQMKKGRPGTLVQALARPAGREALERVLFAHTPTLGVRWLRCERTECARTELVVEVLGTPVRVKQRLRPGGGVTELDLSPEHEDLARLARATGKALRELERAAITAAWALLG